jgi:UDP-N-acetylmuramoyl-L-alanyl-D-glutamate--2,6-diaminopimelate ligase
VLVELNRQVAIETVLQLANLNDIVVIAGKGHEAYQDVKGVKSPFSDQQVVLDWLARRHNGE